MKCLIADDEPHALRSIEILLEKVPDLTVVATCNDGQEALNQIILHRPDLILLDIQMPGLNGFEVAEQVLTHYHPQIVFITAYDEYAIRAFDINAVDYIVKPYDDLRFYKALNRAKERYENTNLPQANYQAAVSTYQSFQSTQIRHISVRTGNSIKFVEDQSIVWIEAADQYCNIHTASENHLIRESMRFFEENLDPKLFFRASRSAIININYIKELQLYKKNRYLILLKTGDEVELGAGKLEALKQLKSFG